jgi:hypothetical protein
MVFYQIFHEREILFSPLNKAEKRAFFRVATNAISGTVTHELA